MEQLDNRAQSALGGTAKTVVTLVVGIAVLALLSAFLAPIAINALEGEIASQEDRLTASAGRVASKLDIGQPATKKRLDKLVRGNEKVKRYQPAQEYQYYTTNAVPSKYLKND